MDAQLRKRRSIFIRGGPLPAACCFVSSGLRRAPPFVRFFFLHRFSDVHLFIYRPPLRFVGVPVTNQNVAALRTALRGALPPRLARGQKCTFRGPVPGTRAHCQSLFGMPFGIDGKRFTARLFSSVDRNGDDRRGSAAKVGVEIVIYQKLTKYIVFILFRLCVCVINK